MVDNRNPFDSFLTVVAGEKIPRNELNISSGIEAERLFEATKSVRRSNEATYVGKAVLEKYLNDFGSNETIRSRHQNAVVQGYNVFRIHAEASATNRALNCNK
jgi:hypothetical protein